MYATPTLLQNFTPNLLIKLQLGYINVSMNYNIPLPAGTLGWQRHVGASGGGPIAAHAARKWPCRVGRLTVSPHH